MAYRLDLHGNVPDALRATAKERLQHAASVLRESGDAEAVHSARKDLKKTRSLLRLAPGDEGKDYRRRNDELRAIANSLSGTRDADVLVETIDGLREPGAGRLPRRAFTSLANRARRQAAATDGAPAAVSAAAESLGAAADDVDAWSLDRASAGTLADGIGRAYQRGRDALREAGGHPDSDRLHEWRKRVKDLWYHAQLLRDAAPGPMKALADDTDELAELLGDEHDLALLVDLLRRPDGLARGLVLDVDLLIGIADGERARLRARAALLAAGIYAERPQAFRRRVAAYLEPRVPDLAAP